MDAIGLVKPYKEPMRQTISRLVPDISFEGGEGEHYNYNNAVSELDTCSSLVCEKAFKRW